MDYIRSLKQYIYINQFITNSIDIRIKIDQLHISRIFIILHVIFCHTVQFRAFAYEGYMDIQSTEATTKLSKTNARRSFSSSTARRQIRNQINPMHNSRKQNGIIFFPLNLTETKIYSPKHDS